MYVILLVIDMYINLKNKIFWLCLEIFLYNIVIVNNIIVGIFVISLIVMFVLWYICWKIRIFIYSCEEMILMVDFDSFIVFFLIIIFVIYEI